jgi:hypothetical protein
VGETADQRREWQGVRKGLVGLAEWAGREGAERVEGKKRGRRSAASGNLPA